MQPKVKLMIVALVVAVVGIALSAPAQAADTTKPVVTLASPTSSVFDSVNTSIVVTATDDVGLSKVVANIYRDGTLFKSTQSNPSGATEFTHSVDLAAVPGVGLLPVGNYSVRYNAIDTTGNVASTGNFPFEVDTTAPKCTVKPGSTVGPNGAYTTVPSFKLEDAGVGQVDYVLVNGAKKDLSNNKWSDLNVGGYKPAQGLNTVDVYDTAGNSSSCTFVLDTVAPTVTSEAQVWQTKDGGRTSVTLTFSEPVSGLGQGWNGSGAAWNKVYYNTKSTTVTFVDAAGNTGSYTFVPQGPPPAAS